MLRIIISSNMSDTTAFTPAYTTQQTRDFVYLFQSGGTWVGDTLLFVFSLFKFYFY